MLLVEVVEGALEEEAPAPVPGQRELPVDQCPLNAFRVESCLRKVRKVQAADPTSLC